MKTLVVVVLISFLAFGCKQSSNTKNESNSTQVVLNAPELDSSSTSKELKTKTQSLVKKIDDLSLEATKKQKLVSLFNLEEAPATLWYTEDGTLLKIECASAGESGNINAIISYYFVDGDLWYSDQVFAKYIFKEDRLQFWLDEQWNINQIPSENMKSRERIIQQQVEVLTSN